MKKITSTAAGFSLALALAIVLVAQVAEAASSKGRTRVYPERARAAYATMGRSTPTILPDISGASSVARYTGGISAPAGR